LFLFLRKKNRGQKQKKPKTSKKEKKSFPTFSRKIKDTLQAKVKNSNLERKMKAGPRTVNFFTAVIDIEAL
jgi:hypothetical protein